MKNENGKPLKSMTFEELTDHIQSLFNEAHVLKRQAALVVVRAGEALAHAKETLPEGLTWVKFQAELGLPRATVNEAIRLHKAAHEEGLTEKDLAGMGIMDAKYRLRIRLKNVQSRVKADQRRVSLTTKATTRNALLLMDKSLTVLEKAVSAAENGVRMFKYDESKLEQFSQLLVRLSDLGRYAKQASKLPAVPVQE